MNTFEVHEFTLPIWASSYLINSDPSGLEDDDIQLIDDFVMDVIGSGQLASFHCVDADVDNSYFAYSNDLHNKGDQVCTFTFHSYENDQNH